MTPRSWSVQIFLRKQKMQQTEQALRDYIMNIMCEALQK